MYNNYPVAGWKIAARMPKVEEKVPHHRRWCRGGGRCFSWCRGVLLLLVLVFLGVVDVLLGVLWVAVVHSQPPHQQRRCGKVLQ